MRPGYRQHAPKAFIALLLLMLAAWLVPSFFSAERYRRRLEAGLEGALLRPATFGALSFRLLPRPGFSIENAVVREDPAFGSEPFAHVERIACDLRWQTLWRSHLEFARLHLDYPTFNFVRNAAGVWNIESLLLKSAIASPSSPVAGAARSVGALDLEADNARINFKVGANKKPLAITDLQVGLNFDPSRRLLRYRLVGSPIRTDLSLPTPGVLELAGEWTPGKDLEGPINATLRTRGGLLYDWVPLVTGQNPGIYGVLDAEIRLTGSLGLVKIDGQGRLSQLHRWELLPPSASMPLTLYFRGQFDRTRGRALLESVDAEFADSHIHLTGSVEKIPHSPELDLVVALERSRLEDLRALGRRFWGDAAPLGVSGRVDGLLAIQGPWSERRYSGFVNAQEVRLNTDSGTFPVSEVALRIDPRGARLAPVRLTLAPHVEVVAQGVLHLPAAGGPGNYPLRDSTARLAASPARYELMLSMRAVPLRDLVRLGRAVGVRTVQGLDAQGLGTATFVFAGSAWPPTRPTLAGRAELYSARLLVPGLTEPLHIPRAIIRVNGDQVISYPVVAVMGTSVFTGRLEHQGERRQPWKFDVRADRLSLEQGALWFDVLGHRPPLSLLERLPGLSSFAARRVAAWNLFSTLNAQGHFATSSLTYHSLALADFRASVEISGRIVRVNGATFRTGGGLGQGRAQVDLTDAPARVSADITLAETKLQTWASYLPTLLRGVRGSLSGTGHFESLGLTRGQMSANLQGRAKVNLKNVSFGDFDPLEALARANQWGTIEPARREVGLRSAVVTLEVRDRRVVLRRWPLELAGAKLELSGIYGFDGLVGLEVHADLSHVTRRWLDSEGQSDPDARLVDLHLAGPLDKLRIVPEMQVSRSESLR